MLHLPSWPAVSIRISIAVINYPCYEHLGGEGFILVILLCRSPSLKEVTPELRAGTWRYELKQRPGRSSAFWLVSHGLLSLLSCITQDTWPGVVLPRVGWTLPHPSLIENMLSVSVYILAYRPILCRLFPN